MTKIYVILNGKQFAEIPAKEGGFILTHFLKFL